MKYIIIGTGNISNTYVNALNNLEQHEVVGFVSRSKSHTVNGKTYPTWPNLELVDQDFDAVVVATPNGLHCDGIIAAAQLGKHVLTEKPLGINKVAMHTALDLCHNNQVTLAVAYQHRTSPDNISVKALLERGELGKVFAADLSAKFYRTQAYYDSAEYRGGYAIDGGGPFMQQACHNIDVYTWFFGKPKKVVSLMGTFAHNIEAEDHGAAILQHEDGMIGTIVASTAAQPGFAARLEVHTSKGSFTMVDNRITEWHFEDLPNPANTDFNYAHDGAKSASVSDTSAHEAIILDFEAAIKTGKTPIADGLSTQLTSELILDIYEADMGN